MGLNKRVREDLAVGIVWIGHTLDPEYQLHNDIIKEKIQKKQDSDEIHTKKSDRSKFYPRFELTSFGEPICLNEHLSKVSSIE